MANQPTRRERLRALRERERAEALIELGRAERAAAGLVAEVDHLRERLLELAETVGAPVTGSAVAAGVLAAGSRRHQLDRKRLAQLEADLVALRTRRDAALARVDRARDAVAAASRALKALGEHGAA